MCHYDCSWYLSIVDAGYHLQGVTEPTVYGQANWAFFPLYPALSAAASAVTGLSPRLGLLVVSNVAFAGLLLVAVLYWRRTRGGDERTTLLVLLVICAWPYGFYFSSGYTEALFGLLLLGILLLMRTGRPLTAAILAALLSATRPTGIVIVAIIVIAHAWPVLQATTLRTRRAWCAADGLRLIEAVAFASVGAVGLSVYMLFLHLHLGDALAFKNVQIAWARGEFANPVERLLDGVMAFDLARLHAAAPQEAVSRTYFGLLGIAALALCAWLAFRRRRWLEAAVGAAPLLIGAATELYSVPRYAFANPVLILASVELLRTAPSPWRDLGLASLASLQVWLLGQWYRHAVFLI
jgi:hypothetical protein